MVCPLAPLFFGSSSSLFTKNLSPPFSPFTGATHTHRCGYQQKALMGGCVGVGEIRRGDISVSDGLVCPKPRRNGLFNEPIKPSRFLQINNQQPEGCDLKAGTELLDIILSKGNFDMETPNFDMASSPPFFFGSPPSRASNPLIQDSQFSNNNFVPILAIPEAAPSPPQSSASTHKSGGGCAPVKFGIKPATVRIEGFNCRSSISAFA
ncbi:uncharacterized protein LOC107012545 isoform X2 [Solanum pennellii]|uniref:Uncharacterized protein LOC107012545 isoform X2 n=1 Tax=Solanum pennellii TaxID=28526 RepID=A0ABM1G9N2_SOLPN|nr:uncharacterized protein LOC107012545 isoform X2 [Solanum pennellii]